MAGSCDWWVFSGPRKRCECRKRCRSWFPNNIQLQEGCEKRCDTNEGMKMPTDYTCTIEPESFIQAYGYDGCPFDDVTFEGVKNKFDDGSEQMRRQRLFIIVVILVMVLLYFILKYFSRK